MAGGDHGLHGNGQPGQHWAMRVSVGGGASGRPSVKPGVGISLGGIEIRNLESGEIGHFGYVTLDVGADMGASFGVGNGEWAYFETTHLETMDSFSGAVRMYSLEAFTETLMARIHLPVDIAAENLWGNLNPNSIDISGTSDSVALGVNWGVGELQLLYIEDGPPAENLLDGVLDIVYGSPPFDVTAGAAARQLDMEAEANTGQYDMRQDLPSEPFDMTADSAERELNMDAEANTGQFDMRPDGAAEPGSPSPGAGKGHANETDGAELPGPPTYLDGPSTQLAPGAFQRGPDELPAPGTYDDGNSTQLEQGGYQRGPDELPAPGTYDDGNSTQLELAAQPAPEPDLVVPPQSE